MHKPSSGRGRVHDSRSDVAMAGAITDAATTAGVATGVATGVLCIRTRIVVTTDSVGGHPAACRLQITGAMQVTTMFAVALAGLAAGCQTDFMVDSPSTVVAPAIPDNVF